MAKIRKAVFKSGIVMMSLLAAIVLSSSVAYAQRCEARAATTNDGGDSVAVATVRAEGMTEEIGGIELRCVPSEDTGSLFAITEFTLSVTLNTPITSLMGVAYEGALLSSTGTLGSVATAIATEFDDPNETDDGPMIDADEDPSTVVWEELSGATLGLGVGGSGFNVIITGIRANAYMVGDDGEISAQLTVNTQPVSPGAFDVSDVKTGLVVKVDDANVLQCETMEMGMATISITEGFATAFSDEADAAENHYDMVEVNFSGIPDGVTVMITHTATDQSPTGTQGALEDDPMKFTLTGEGDAPATGTMVEVEIDEDGDGDITYTVSDADSGATAMAQANMLMVNFSWEEDTMIADGMVSVGWESATEGNPQFADAAAVRVIGFDPCETSMRFPFVTNMYGYDTGIAFTNASNYAGACEIKFYGAETNPAPMDTMEVPSWGSMTYGLSVIAMGFQGFLDVTCNFQNGHGFAFISNGFGSMGGPTAAQGYLAVTQE